MLHPNMVEKERFPLEPEEHAELGRLIRAADAAKHECAAYIDKLGAKYSLQARSRDCSIGFESGFVVLYEPQMVFRAS